MNFILGILSAVLAFLGLKVLNKKSIEKSNDAVNVLKGRKEEIEKRQPPTEVPKLTEDEVVDYWKDKV